MSMPFSESYGFRQRSKGYQSIATAGTTTNIDIVITEERYITGVQINLKNHTFGDKMSLQVVDKDNIFGYGAGAILDTFGADWNVADDHQSQGTIESPYPAKLIAGLYIRIVYVSTGSVDVLVHPNFFFHKKVE